MARAEPISTGDRAIYRGIGQRNGKSCDVLAARPQVSSIRFDDSTASLALTDDLTPIARRPKPMF